VHDDDEKFHVRSVTFGFGHNEWQLNAKKSLRKKGAEEEQREEIIIGLV
jgi:hypothetical protein